MHEQAVRQRSRRRLALGMAGLSVCAGIGGYLARDDHDASGVHVPQGVAGVETSCADAEPVMVFLESASGDMDPEALDGARAKIDVYFRQSMVNYEGVESVRALGVDEYVGFAPQSRSVREFAQRQSLLIGMVKGYFGVALPYSVGVAQDVGDLVSAPECFVANIVARREWRAELEVWIRCDGRARRTENAQVEWSNDEANVDVSWSVRNTGDGVLQVVQSPRRVIIPAVSDRVRISGPLEYMHVVRAPVVQEQYMQRAPAVYARSGQLPTTDEEMVEDEAVVHGCVLAALEQMGEVSAADAERMLVDWRAPKYARVRELYLRAHLEGPRKVFDEYAQDLVRRE